MGWFGSSKPETTPTSVPVSEFSDIAPPSTSGSASDPVSASESAKIKTAFMRQVQMESNAANARMLMENINANCFEKCVPTPGSSLSSGESSCVTSCMEKYMAAWNIVNASYLRRIQQESANAH